MKKVSLIVNMLQQIQTKMKIQNPHKTQMFNKQIKLLKKEELTLNKVMKLYLKMAKKYLKTAIMKF